MIDISPFHPDYEIFLRVAEAKSISKVAEVMGVGQPGLSKSIRRLESELGIVLFARRNQGVELTRDGTKLLFSLRQTKAAWQSTRSNHPANDLTGSYSIGGHASVLAVYLPGPLSRLHAQLPLIDFSMSLATSLETTRLVAGLKLDFGIVVNLVRTTDLVVKRIGVDDIVQCHRKSVEPKRLYYNPEMFDIGKLLRRFSHKKTIAVPDYQIIKRLIEVEDCEAVLPKSLVLAELPSLTVQALRKVQISLIYHSLNAQSPVFSALSAAFVR